MTAADKQAEWPLFESSGFAKRTLNTLREVVETLKMPVNHPKPFISLSLGDPTTRGNLPPAPSVNAALKAKIDGQKHNGYPMSSGFKESRAAVAEKFSYPNAPLTSDDVILTNGCGHAIEIALTGSLNKGDGILLPAPGFSLYTCMAEAYDFNVQMYRLNPEKSWEADMDDLERKVDHTTKLLLITNPSNPCGSVYSREHLIQLAEFATRHKLIVVADEIYAHMSFDPTHPFVALAEAAPSLPVISVGGISKQYLVPGWRTGWLTVYNRHGALTQLMAGFQRLISLILGPNSLVQAALPEMLHHTAPEYYTGLLDTLRDNAIALFGALEKIPGLKPIMPQGAMYMMVGLDVGLLDFDNDVDFSRQLLQEGNVMALPGKVFHMPDFVRLIITLPKEELLEAASRMKDFCARHPRKTNGAEDDSEEPAAKRARIESLLKE